MPEDRAVNTDSTRNSVPSSPSVSTNSTYVYPVRSLLHGPIEPAGKPSRPPILRRPSSSESLIVQLDSRASKDRISSQTQERRMSHSLDRKSKTVPEILPSSQVPENNALGNSPSSPQPAQLSEVAANAFAKVALDVMPSERTSEYDGSPPDIQFNLSEYSRLPPISPNSSVTTSSDNPTQSTQSSSLKVTGSSQSSVDLIPSTPLEETSVLPENISVAAGEIPQARFHSSTAGVAVAGSHPLKAGSTPTGSPSLVNVRFQHVRDENGYHCIVGREGKITRCEDEPIRTPGAIQGYGVLIALDEDVENETLVVRQVSENSTELLGLSPKFLFSLECFTDTLPDSQIDVIWDNIQFLNQTESENSEENEDGPHVFLLTGWSEPNTPGLESAGSDHERQSWTCWCAVHRPQQNSQPGPGSGRIGGSFGLIVLELELEKDLKNLISQSPGPVQSSSVLGGLGGQENWVPPASDIFDSTISRAKPLMALERLRRINRNSTYSSTYDDPRPRRRARRNNSASASAGMMDVFAVMAQINEQFGSATNVQELMDVIVGVIKDLTQFHRVLVYQFDEAWNGNVVAELVDWSQTHDLYKGLRFPAVDIPPQARDLYAINKVRILYDRSQTTARIVVKHEDDLRAPLNMTHCFLRAMSPIHLKYLENMGVRASMSISIMAFGSLWGLVACHSYGSHGMRVSFPVRQMLRLLSQSMSRNVERVSYAQRLNSRKIIPMSQKRSTGHIMSNTDDLLSLVDADYGILVIGEAAKILGPHQHGQEILVMVEYLRLKQFTTIQVCQAVVDDFPDLNLSTGLEVIAGLLHVPLSSGGKDFIAFLRKGERHEVNWAGRPYKDNFGSQGFLEPRKSFEVWSESVTGRCRAWTDEQLETAGVLALVYGKFIEVWRQKENALQTTKLANIILSNASHEVRTPLNHIINYLEMALNGPLDVETRDNLSRSHTASKSLLFTINDLLDLTRLESNNETSFNEPFNLRATIEEATQLYQNEAKRRNIGFRLDIGGLPKSVVGDAMKIRTVISNLTANALKYTSEGELMVRCYASGEHDGPNGTKKTIIDIVVGDTGCGIEKDRLENIFRDFEQVESGESRSESIPGVGLGLAVVARIVAQLGGQLRVDSEIGKGSRFSFLIPLSINYNESIGSDSSQLHAPESATPIQPQTRGPASGETIPSIKEVKESKDTFDVSNMLSSLPPQPPAAKPKPLPTQKPPKVHTGNVSGQLRVLIVEDNDINRMVLAKRLKLDGHTVVNTTNGQEGLDMVISDKEFDCVLMDIQMPIMNGFEATERIRIFEKQAAAPTRLSHTSNTRIPIFVVSASLVENEREKLLSHGVDGWILKPINFKRLKILLQGVIDPLQRERDLYRPGYNWELGGWLCEPGASVFPSSLSISSS